MTMKHYMDMLPVLNIVYEHSEEDVSSGIIQTGIIVKRMPPIV